MSRSDLPTGTVTFLFTDIEGSTRLLQAMGPSFSHALERHAGIIRSVITQRDGTVVKNEADGFFAVFRSAVAAVAAAVDIQRAMAAEDWDTPWPVRVRIGAHTGEAMLGGADYVGFDVHLAARIGAAGHGGQVVLSAITARLVEHNLGEGVRLEDLGMHRLKDIQEDERLYQVSIDGLQSSFPPVRTLTTSKGNLPTVTTQMIGRQRERERLIEALQSSRLVTITGTAGIGKTTLALGVAGEVLTAYPDGVWLVEVSRLTEPGLLADTIARHMHITETQGEETLTTIGTRLNRAMALLVLDGCEHLVDEVISVVDHLLRNTTALRILVTSREWLEMRGEHLVALEPLPLPPEGIRSPSAIAGYDAIALFLERARLAAPGFELDEVSAPVVAEICRRLDGIPLAMELAAARLNMMTPDQLLDRLDRQFSVLGSRPGSPIPHQQTLEATLDWSYDALGPVERTLFNRLSVFTGGFTLDAAEEVCADSIVPKEAVLEILGRLIETSLVAGSEDRPGRFRLLKPIAQYAAMRLADGEDAALLRERHAEYFCAVADGPDPLGGSQAERLETLDLERYNIRAALSWLDGHNRGEDVLRIAGHLRWYWVIRRDVTEGWHWLERGFEFGSEDPAILARGHEGVGLLSTMRLDFDRAGESFSEALRLQKETGNLAGVARDTYHLSVVAWLRDDHETAHQLGEEAETLARDAGDRWTEGWSLAVRGTIHRCNGELASAQAQLQRSHGIIASMGGAIDTGWSFLRLGALARDQGDHSAAAEYYATGRDLLLHAGDHLGVAHADAGLGAMAWLAGDREKALTLFRGVLEGFSFGEEASSNLFELKTMIQGNPSTESLMQVVTMNRRRAGETEGHVGAKAALAEYLYHMGKTAQRAGESYRAAAPLRESLALCIEAVDGRGAAIAAAALAGLLAEQGSIEAAARLHALAERTARRDRLPDWPPPDEIGYTEGVETLRMEMGGGWREALEEGEGMTWEAALDLVDVSLSASAVSGTLEKP